MADVKFSEFLDGDELKLGDQVVGLRGGLNYRFDFPGNGIKDGNGSYFLQWATAGASSVNFLLFTNSVAGNPVLIESAGSDTDIDITINPKGIGNVNIPANVDQVTQLNVDNLRLDGSTISATNVDGSIFLVSDGAGAINIDGLKYPKTDGTAGQFMYTDGFAQLAFTSASFPIAPGPVGTLLQSDGSGWVPTTATYPGVATTSGTILRADGTNWLASTATYPDTTTINRILFSSANNTVSQIAAANGGVLISNSSGVPSMLANPTATGRIFQSVSGDASVWSTASYPGTAGSVGTILRSDGTNWLNTTATYPNTTTINRLLFSSANNTIGEVSTVASAALVTTSAGVPTYTLTMSNGQLVIGSTGGTPTAATLTAGTNITITNGAGSITIDSTGGTVSAGLQNQLAWYAANGSAVSGLATANNGVLITSSGGVPSISSTLPNAVQLNITSLGTVTAGTWAATTITVDHGGTGRASATAYALLAGGTTSTGAHQSIGSGATGQMLQSQGNAALPTYSTATFPSTATSTGTILRADGTNWVATTATYPTTTTINRILFSSATNTISEIATANSAVLVTSSTGVPSLSSTMTNGQLIIGSTGATPTAATLTAGTGVSITNAAGSITINATGSGMSWTTIAGTTQAAAVDSGYVSGNAAQTTITLPATAAVGAVIAVEGLGAGGWVLTANTGQTIKIGTSTTTSAGSLTSFAASDNVYVTCIVANTTWRVQTTNSAGLTVT